VYIRFVYLGMIFEWDSEKAAENVRTHGIPFEVACEVFGGPTLEKYDDRADYGEDRWIAVGFVNQRVIAVVFTERGDATRLISARKATTDERKRFEDSLRPGR
jgi:uncharacterized DUF497 family protein